MAKPVVLLPSDPRGPSLGEEGREGVHASESLQGSHWSRFLHQTPHPHPKAGQ